MTAHFMYEFKGDLFVTTLEHSDKPLLPQGCAHVADSRVILQAPALLTLHPCLTSCTLLTFTRSSLYPTTMHAHLEPKIQQAILGLESGTYKTVASAARALNINKSTLHYRLHGAVPNHSAHAAQQLLSPEQERVLVDWAKYSAMLALPLGRRTLYPKAFALTGKVPGKNWYTRLIKRHPEIKSRKPTYLDPKRASDSISKV